MDKITIGEVAQSMGPREPLHDLLTSTPIGVAIDSMDSQKLLVAPVRNDNSEYCALVSVFDLINYAIVEKMEPGQEGSLEPEAIPALKDKVGEVIAEGYRRFELPIFSSSDSIFGPMKEFAGGHHKVMVNAKEANPAFLFSQHDLIKFMNDNPSAIPEDLQAKTAEDLGFAPLKSLVTARTDASVLDVLRLLSQHDMTAVPLLDEKGHIAGTFSQSDLKGLAQVMLVDLKMQVIPFLEDEEARGAGRPITVKSDAKLGEIILPLAYSGAHRIWVVDDNNCPIGVASMTGVISAITTMLLN
eukprot:Plantae.Rhodophyta-Purpureofilum_apyrenoidigerum.ctg3072.p2 GENE.Plantae.Rhodophyta-Purpureofilum_apyrenoidigerum.ctg3072~~Plantae.Rhodophyta-Purpureofilum_apyrenoidigerum.ctg3072.p2  ORF type:complete len:300 (-),score=57.56 Plantae.Rhodophyta-Purpureofilum_apyrenoidigerum.ctg3072:1686-2585(-)